MQRVSRVQTSDGRLFDTLRQATEHAENRYGELLSRLAHRMIHADKYSAAMKFIEENLAAFVELHRLKADITLQTDDEDERLG